MLGVYAVVVVVFIHCQNDTEDGKEQGLLLLWQLFLLDFRRFSRLLKQYS